jgi:hypothetical protein
MCIVDMLEHKYCVRVPQSRPARAHVAVSRTAVPVVSSGRRLRRLADGHGLDALIRNYFHRLTRRRRR